MDNSNNTQTIVIVDDEDIVLTSLSSFYPSRQITRLRPLSQPMRLWNILKMAPSI